jgi:type VI secretion system protein ImpH
MELLFEQPSDFTFVEAVRLLEQAARRRKKTSPAGESRSPGATVEVARFRAATALAFAPAEIAKLSDAGADEPVDVEVCFLGLNGPSGVLPRVYSEFVQQQTRQKSLALRDFLDIFNDRAIRNHLDASRKYRLPAAFELAGGSYGDPMTAVLRALIGMSTPALAGRTAVGQEALLSYAGLFSHQVRSAAGLEQILRDFLGRPAQVLQLTGRWALLDPADRTALPDADHPNGNYAELGVNAVLGSRIFDVQGAFRVRLGPLDYQEFTDLLPGSPLMRQVADLTRLYVGPSLAFDVQLSLRREAIPQCMLGGKDPPLLGLNTWLFTSERATDAADVVIRFERL